LVTFIVGYTTSVVLKRLNKEGPNILYSDGDVSSINCDLFSPPKARALRKRLGKIEENGSTVAMPEGKMLNDSSF
jgi:solute carrier family 5 (sodium-coupled monocarboxylate transporter), member 8/12